MIRKKILSQQGFTLIEVLVSCVIIIALGIGILGLQKIISQTQTFVFSRYLSVDQANSSMQALVKELRTARAGDNGAYPLELADDNEIIFYSDIDFDGETEKIHYWLEGEDFYKGIIEPEGYPVIYPLENKKTKLISSNVRNGEMPIFYYYNGSWPDDAENNPLPMPARLSDTKIMHFLLRLNNEKDQPDKDFILESYVQIRMLKENL